MLASATFALAFLAASAARADLYDGPCVNEVSLLCPGRSPGATLRCLNEHEDDLMTSCRQALSELRANERAARAAQAAATPAPPPAPTAPPPAPVLREARLVGALGAVFVHIAGRPDDQVVAVTSGTPLSEGDTVLVGDGGGAELALDGASLVSLSSGTELALTSLSRAQTELGLALGELAAKIEHLGAGENLRVRTPALVAAVRGTELMVAQDGPDTASRVGVADEGRVQVDAGGKSVTLGPRQETAAPLGGAPEPPRPLASFRARADAFAAIRSRAEASRGDWKPVPDSVRRGARERLAGRAPRARFGVVRPRVRPAPAARPATRARPR